jgi:8-oxo-dGTP diphosphatase
MANDRRYPQRPILGVGALIFNRDKILLVERGKEPLKGYWSLPGGVLETGETLEQGVVREVREETGLEVKPVKVLEIFERIIRDASGAAEYHYVLIPHRLLSSYQITAGTVPVIEKGFRQRRQRL